MPSLLLIDSEIPRRSEFATALRNILACECMEYDAINPALNRLLSCRNPQPDLILIDISTRDFPSGHIIRTMRHICPSLAVIVLCEEADSDRLREAMEAGAHDFLPHKASRLRLERTLKNALDFQRLRGQAADAEHSVRLLDRHGNLRSLNDIEREIYCFALTYSRDSRSDIARRLGIGRTTLYRKVQQLNLNPETAEKQGEITRTEQY